MSMKLEMQQPDQRYQVAQMQRICGRVDTTVDCSWTAQMFSDCSTVFMAQHQSLGRWKQLGSPRDICYQASFF